MPSLNLLILYRNISFFECECGKVSVPITRTIFFVVMIQLFLISNFYRNLESIFYDTLGMDVFLETFLHLFCDEIRSWSLRHSALQNFNWNIFNIHLPTHISDVNYPCDAEVSKHCENKFQWRSLQSYMSPQKKFPQTKNWKHQFD